ncbi:hypothetical protein LEP1GSC175_3799 [Leptospira santarosai str. HAI821]|uniref:hypothetical protein n=1 Tax=Leptospira santarosai TaxID=28183 RepID=UPI0002BE952F|nr:hypothetical protein [Leptospira santarosai]EMO31735.1 hypothetical protein LEP1GSC175_3799 [Leptospira santarosai str. HAI821]
MERYIGIAVFEFRLKSPQFFSIPKIFQNPNVNWKFKYAATTTCNNILIILSNSSFEMAYQPNKSKRSYGLSFRRGSAALKIFSLEG